MGDTATNRETPGRAASSRRAFLEQLLCGACTTSAHRATDLAPFLPCGPAEPEPPAKPRVRVNNGTPQVPELPPVVRIPLRCHVSTRAWWDAAGKRLLFGTEEGDVAELDVRTRRMRALFRAPFPLIKDDSVAVSPRGTRVATPGRDGVVEIRDTRRGALISTLRGQKEEVQRLVWSPDARYLVTTSFNSCRVWDVPRRQQLAAFDRLSAASGIAWSPDGTRIALARYLGQVLVLRAPGAELLRPMRYPPPHDRGWPHPVAWNRLGTRVVCSGLVIPEIEVYQAADGRHLQTLDGFVGQVAGLVVEPPPRLPGGGRYAGAREPVETGQWPTDRGD